MPRGARLTATGRSELLPGDPGVQVGGPRAAESTRPQPRRPAPHPLGPSVRRRPDAPGSAGGAARESPHRAPSERGAGLGAEPGKPGSGPVRGALSGWWDARRQRDSPGFQQRSTGGRGHRGLGAVCGRPGARGNSHVPPAWSRASTRRLLQLSILRWGTVDNLGSQQGKGFPGRWVNPKTSPKAKRTESHPSPPYSYPIRNGNLF